MHRTEHRTTILEELLEEALRRAVGAVPPRTTRLRPADRTVGSLDAFRARWMKLHAQGLQAVRLVVGIPRP